MAGSEKRGVEFAQADLFRNAICILTPTARTDSEALKEVGTFWLSLGMGICRLTAENHDHILADVSHLPHLLAAALVAIQPAESSLLRGKGFLDATRIAAGDAVLWRDILMDNSKNLQHSISRLQQELQKIVSMLQNGDSVVIRKWLADAAPRREQLGAEPL
jgi:prephenate dehydrogenase